MFCHLCGNKIKEDEVFCRNCGEMTKHLSENEPDWLKRSGLFLLGMVGFCVFLIVFLFLIQAFLPLWKSPQTLVVLLLVSSVLLSGLTSILLFEKNRSRKKLLAERKKEQAALPKNEPRLIEEKDFEAVPISVTEFTTKELDSHKLRNRS